MDHNVTRIFTWAGNEILQSHLGLLPKEHWAQVLESHPTGLLCSVRERLVQVVPGLTEKFNVSSRYFGYCVQGEMDRAYVYVQKQKLVIDLCISPDCAKDLRQAGFTVRPRRNFQGNAGWLTGWQVAHSAQKVDTITAWICKAFSAHI